MPIEPFLNVREAANTIGVPYFKLRRFVNSGAAPIYRVGNSRKLLRLSELIIAIEASSHNRDEEG